MVVALIDADVLCYTAAAVGVQDIDWDETGEATRYLNEARAVEIVESVIADWLKKAETEKYRLVFSDRSHSQATFRYLIHPHYKGQRAPEKPPLHDYIYDYLQSKPNVVSIAGLEGDDVLGILQSKPDSDYVSVTIDKDMLTVPGRVCNPHKGTVDVTLFQADYNWMFQTLTGDTVDNYKGAPGIGEQGARKRLTGCKNIVDMWAAVIEGYNDQFENERWNEKFVNSTAWDEAIMNARCARILRDGDYNRETKQVRLWDPDGEHEWLGIVNGV